MSTTGKPRHFSFWNRAAVCFYCTTMKFDIPITLREIMNVNIEVKRDRFFKIGKTIMVKELGESNGRISIAHRVSFIKRMFREYCGPRHSTIEISTIQTEINRVEKKYSHVDSNIRLILVYMTFMPKCPTNKRDALNSAFMHHLINACSFFGTVKQMWIQDLVSSN